MITHASLLPHLDGDSISFHGELDVFSAPELSSRIGAVAAAPGGPLLIDLSGCAFIDSLGIAALVEGCQAMHQQGRGVAIVCRSPQVRRTLALTGVAGVVSLCWSREEAIELLGGPEQAVRSD